MRGSATPLSEGVGEAVWQVEQSEFCRGVLARHWPRAKRYNDVKTVGAHNLAPVDLICGGFPCQDISSAGKGAGLSGDRSGLWFEFARIIGELQPTWVVVENVASGAVRWVDAVTKSLGLRGYEVLPVPISAQAVGAPHRRNRVFLVAYSKRVALRQQSRRGSGPRGQGATLAGLAGEAGATADTNGQGESAEPLHEQVGGVRPTAGHGGWVGGPPVSPVCGVDARVPNRVDRLRALGNAVVPQCAEVVGEIINMLQEKHNDSA